MQRMKKINFWVGVVVSVVLLIESAYGVYTYFQRNQRSFQQRAFSQNMPNTFSTNSGSNSSGSNSSQFGRNFQNGNRGLRSSMAGTANFQSSPFGLTVDILGLILAGAALVMTSIIGRFNLKKRKELIDSSKVAHD